MKPLEYLGTNKPYTAYDVILRKQEQMEIEKVKPKEPLDRDDDFYDERYGDSNV